MTEYMERATIASDTEPTPAIDNVAHRCVQRVTSCCLVAGLYLIIFCIMEHKLASTFGTFAWNDPEYKILWVLYEVGAILNAVVSTLASVTYMACYIAADDNKKERAFSLHTIEMVDDINSLALLINCSRHVSVKSRVNNVASL
ncbi:hypothetical protein Bbelb_026350 [Branchiostoma belcheri]|nr:hypothetical protein Bbelb_026350 [Branchiostoma belcheri]